MTHMPIALSMVEGCAQSSRAVLWRMAYSVWFRLYAISYQPYATYRRLASEILLSSLQEHRLPIAAASEK